MKSVNKIKGRSAEYARKRMTLLLVSERLDCSPQMINMLKNDLIRTVKKNIFRWMRRVLISVLHRNRRLFMQRYRYGLKIKEYRKMIKQYKLRFYNFRLVIFLLAISTFGIILVGSAREDLKTKQLAGVIIGLIIMVILSLIDYSWISNFQWIMYGANIVLLLIVRLFGDSANGAARWIDFGFIRFQPTELSKIIIICFLHDFLWIIEEDLNTFRTLAKSVILLAIPLILIYEQPDMKNTLMMLAVFCILIYIAGLSYKVIGGMFLIIIPLSIIFLSIVVHAWIRI